MAKKEAAGDLDIDLDALLAEAGAQQTNIEWSPGTFSKHFTKKEGSEKEGGWRGEAARRLKQATKPKEGPTEGIDAMIQSGELPQAGKV